MRAAVAGAPTKPFPNSTKRWKHTPLGLSLLMVLVLLISFVFSESPSFLFFGFVPAGSPRNGVHATAGVGASSWLGPLEERAVRSVRQEARFVGSRVQKSFGATPKALSGLGKEEWSLPPPGRTRRTEGQKTQRPQITKEHLTLFNALPWEGVLRFICTPSTGVAQTTTVVLESRETKQRELSCESGGVILSWALPALGGDEATHDYVFAGGYRNVLSLDWDVSGEPELELRNARIDRGVKDPNLLIRVELPPLGGGKKNEVVFCDVKSGPPAADASEMYTVSVGNVHDDAQSFEVSGCEPSAGFGLEVTCGDGMWSLNRSFEVEPEHLCVGAQLELFVLPDTLLLVSGAPKSCPVTCAKREEVWSRRDGPGRSINPAPSQPISFYNLYLNETGVLWAGCGPFGAKKKVRLEAREVLRMKLPCEKNIFVSYALQSYPDCCSIVQASLSGRYDVLVGLGWDASGLLELEVLKQTARISHIGPNLLPRVEGLGMSCSFWIGRPRAKRSEMFLLEKNVVHDGGISFELDKCEPKAGFRLRAECRDEFVRTLEVRDEDLCATSQLAVVAVLDGLLLISGAPADCPLTCAQTTRAERAPAGKAEGPYALTLYSLLDHLQMAEIGLGCHSVLAEERVILKPRVWERREVRCSPIYFFAGTDGLWEGGSVLTVKLFRKGRGVYHNIAGLDWDLAGKHVELSVLRSQKHVPNATAGPTTILRVEFPPLEFRSSSYPLAPRPPGKVSCNWYFGPPKAMPEMMEKLDASSSPHDGAILLEDPSCQLGGGGFRVEVRCENTLPDVDQDSAGVALEVKRRDWCMGTMIHIVAVEGAVLLISGAPRMCPKACPPSTVDPAERFEVVTSHSDNSGEGDGTLVTVSMSIRTHSPVGMTAFPMALLPLLLLLAKHLISSLLDAPEAGTGWTRFELVNGCDAGTYGADS